MIYLLKFGNHCVIVRSSMIYFFYSILIHQTIIFSMTQFQYILYAISKKIQRYNITNFIVNLTKFNITFSKHELKIFIYKMLHLIWILPIHKKTCPKDLPINMSTRIQNRFKCEDSTIPKRFICHVIHFTTPDSFHHHVP